MYTTTFHTLSSFDTASTATTAGRHGRLRPAREVEVSSRRTGLRLATRRTARNQRS